MKIAFDAKRLFLNNTGLGNYSRTLVRNLHKFFPDNEYFLCTPEVIENEETRYFLENKEFRIIKYPSFFSAFWRSYGVVSKLKKLGVEIFHGLSHEIPIGLKKAGIRSCVTFHDLIFEKYPQYFPAVDNKLYRVKYKYAANHADKIITVSQNTSQDLQELWGVSNEKIEVIYQSCNDVFYNESFPDIGRDIFLYVGAITERKGLRHIIRAYQNLQKEHQFPMVIIGNGGSYQHEVKQLIKNLNLDHLFKFKGPVDNHQLVQYYNKAKALIYPSSYEGFGIPIIEASLRKTPVICSGVSAMPEAGGPDAIYIVPEDHKSIADGIRYCIDNSKEVARKAEKSYIYVLKRVNPHHTAHSLIRIYEDLTK